MDFKKYYENSSFAIKVLRDQDLIDAKFIQEIDKLKKSIMEYVGNRFANILNISGKNHFSTISTMANTNNEVINHLMKLSEIDVQILDFLYSAQIVHFNQILRSIPETFAELVDIMERISQNDLVPDLTHTKSAIDYSLSKIKKNASSMLKTIQMNDELLKISLANEKLFQYMYKFKYNQQKEAESWIINVATWYNIYVPNFIDVCSNYANITIQNLNHYVLNQEN